MRVLMKKMKTNDKGSTMEIDKCITVELYTFRSAIKSSFIDN